jgi:hypothetical protein
MIDPNLLSLFVIIVILGIFIFFTIWSKKKTGIEKGVAPLYEERCSGNRHAFGLFIGGNIPFWRVSFYESFFILSSFEKIILHYHEIDFIEFSRQFLHKKIRICAENPKIDVVIYPKNINRIISIFKSKSVSLFEL